MLPNPLRGSSDMFDALCAFLICLDNCWAASSGGHDEKEVAGKGKRELLRAGMRARSDGGGG